jgi:hypothetical protein
MIVKDVVRQQAAPRVATIERASGDLVIASEAKQSRGKEGSLDCFVAFGSSQ